MEPSRTLHLRHPLGFDESHFVQFVGQCGVLQAYVTGLQDNWPALHQGSMPPPAYLFLPPTLSDDRRTASLPIAGPFLLGHRALIEDHKSRLLWELFDLDFLMQLEEGLTERATGVWTTSWRRVMRSTGA